MTGADGFIATHIVDQLILAGFHVRGSVRDSTKAENISKVFHERYDSSRFETVVIPELSVSGSCEQAMKGCSGVIHAAQDLTLANDFGIIETSISSVNNVLASANRTSSIKRLVYTSSTNAARAPQAGTTYHLTASDWAENVIEDAKAPPPHPPNQGLIIHQSAKVQAERTAWAYMKEHKPSFVLNAILTNINIGPLIATSNPRSTARSLQALYANVPAVIEFFANDYMIPPQQMLDVRDTARLHVLALTEEDVKGERLLAAAEKYDYNTYLDMIYEIGAPEGKPLPEKVEGLAKSGQTIDDKRSLELLARMGRKGWAPVIDAMRETIHGEIRAQ